MNKETMKQQILEALSKKLGDSFHLSIQKVLKTNVKLDGLAIRQDGENIAPTIYLELFYEALGHGASINDVTDRILEIYSNSKIYPEHFDTAPFLHFELPDERLYVELINRHLNEELLQDVPHALFLDDFAIVVRCIVSIAKNESSSFLVHNSHLNYCQMDKDTLISHALHNTRAKMGISLRNMRNVLCDMNQELTEAGIPDCPFWVLTNENGVTGAATVLFDDVLRDFAMEHGSFYVIFSSVHEVLLLPEPGRLDMESLTRMNQEINTTQVQADEVLGTKAYYYSRDKGFVL